MKFLKFFLHAYLYLLIFSSFAGIQNKQTLYLSPFYRDDIELARAHFRDQKPIFLWDLHDVLFFKKSSYAGIKKLLNPLATGNILVNTGKLMFDADFWKIIQTSYTTQQKITQDVWLKLLKNYPITFTTHIIEIATASYLPHKPTFIILKQIHEVGYQNYLFSNIFCPILTKLQKKHARLFTYFASPHNTINHSKNQDYTYKPLPDAYQKALDYTQTAHKPHMVIFIDDNIDNILEAQKQGVSGILYDNKNPHDIHNFISALNLLLDTNFALKTETLSSNPQHDKKLEKKAKKRAHRIIK